MQTFSQTICLEHFDFQSVLSMLEKLFCRLEQLSDEIIQFMNIFIHFRCFHCGEKAWFAALLQL